MTLTPVSANRSADAAPSHRVSSPILVALLVLLTIVGGVFRFTGLNYGGFNEDEVNKVLAVRAYQQGDWGANAEHPMLMKVMMWGALGAADAWNGLASRRGWPVVAPEAAIRLPNALAGAATIVPLFLLAQSFFGTAAGLWAALFLALNVSVTGINRIGKEDSFLALFLVLGAWLYEEARRRHLRGGIPPHRWYAASGAAFGLMLASKYMPYYLGLWATFGLAASAEARRRGDLGVTSSGSRQRASAWFWLAMPLAFVIANPGIVLPATWQYILHYASGGTISHHGSMVFGQLYINQPGATPFGMPWSFYFVYIATKTPLPVLAAMGLGLTELVRRRHERGAVFARVFLVLYLLPASLFASKFGRYLLPSLVLLDMVAALGAVRALEMVSRLGRPAARAAVATGLVTILVAVPLIAQVRWSPNASMYQNAIGGLATRAGTMFPNDELYDMGMREAVQWIARRAAPGASIASDAPGVVREYLRRYGRADIEARALWARGVARPPVDTWLLAQDSHACFESIQIVDQARREQQPDFVFTVRGTVAVAAYRLYRPRIGAREVLAATD